MFQFQFQFQYEFYWIQSFQYQFEFKYRNINAAHSLIPVGELSETLYPLQNFF